MSKPSRIVTLRCPEYLYQAAERYAIENNLLYKGSPNISAVVLRCLVVGLNVKDPAKLNTVTVGELDARLADLEERLNQLKSELTIGVGFASD